MAGGVAAALSGAPSTLYAVATGGDPLLATRAVGSIVLRHERRTVPLVLAALPLHLAISVGWATLLAFLLPRAHPVRSGALAGAVIAALDLGILGRRFPAIRALPVLPQVADHVLFGITVGATLERRRANRTPAFDPAAASCA
ncbi:MAG: hypothetical protein H0W27_03135 [Actinobacteria bacterium]|nr:hypothetical protein [Actinomycetota bacterium]